MQNKKLYYNDITWLKFMATFFITWFHIKWSVPQAFAPLFVGGPFGNSLFFYASGYLLKFKEEKFPGHWILQKLVRILPSVWVFLILTSFLENDMSFSWQNYIYPTPFWFVNCILCYFVVIYLLNKLLGKYKERHLIGIFVLLLSITIIAHITYYMLYVDHSTIVVDIGGLTSCWFFFFIFFLWGYFDKMNKTTYKGNRMSFIGLFVSISIFFVYKRIGCNYYILVFLQWLFVPLLLVPVVYYSRCVSMYLASIQISDRTKHVISMLSNLTLDIYIVQMFLIDIIMPSVSFPINVLISLVAIIGIAYINNYLAGKISAFINTRIL